LLEEEKIDLIMPEKRFLEAIFESFWGCFSVNRGSPYTTSFNLPVSTHKISCVCLMKSMSRANPFWKGNEKPS
jgi:hypothetical protein